MKIFTTVTKWLFILFIPLLLLTIVIQVGSHEAIHLYEYNFDKYDASWGITWSTGLDKTTVIKAARELMDYFHSDENFVNIEVVKNEKIMNLFNEQEQIHLQDVKNLIGLGSELFWISLSYVVLYILIFIRSGKKKKITLLQSVFIGGVITLGLILAFSIAAIVNPEQIFLQFHLISFNNPFWLLDPSKDYLIMMFPEEYFFDIGLYGIVFIIIEALVLISASKLAFKRYATKLMTAGT